MLKREDSDRLIDEIIESSRDNDGKRDIKDRDEKIEEIINNTENN
jgi:hypothetical protein